ncbi:ATP-binding protein [Fictibacillus aquaticus]|uniref:histidine kinase n=1 Tax=Fictibacillus aquaticus TaxID=2021314 RepID=A0A235FFB0_9BACL|nr:sensor histidine kinase [Fictibacillus aquaticus]OYD59455.1 histidine kinase [Fictibacillus aquaticus]
MNYFSIHTKITALIFFIIGFSLLLGGMVLFGNTMSEKESDLEERGRLTSRTVAELPELRQLITGSERDRERINGIVERIRIVNNADYIVVLDMNRVRLSHPVKKQIGTISEGSDEGAAFAEHSYTTAAKGEVGTMIRAFEPIIGTSHEQIGVVITGYRLPSLWEVLSDVKTEIWLTGALSLFFGGWGAWLLARHVRRQMFSLEPHEIARLFVERTETFNAMHEGVIAIDTNERITIFNEKAKQMIGVSGDVTGRLIREVIPDTYLPEILRINRPIYNKELQLGSLNIMSNRVPIKVNGVTVGAVAIFQDRTEVKQMAEELTGVKAFVNALRVQNHEHMNKLHTIAGLIQLGSRDKALDYVFAVTEEQEELTRFLTANLKDDSIAGLLLSKVSRGKELGIVVHIDRNSRLERLPRCLDHHDVVIILGNLIENAFDSFNCVDILEKEIYVSVVQTEKQFTILVEDNGAGIEQSDVPQIFEQGYSTKADEGRGIGLYLVQNIAAKGKGELEVESKPGQGSTFVVLFRVEE